MNKPSPSCLTTRSLASPWISFAETGDVAAWRKQLESVAEQGLKRPAGRISAPGLQLGCSGTKDAAEKDSLALIPAEGIANSFDEAAVPREFCVGRTAWLFGDKELARTCSDSRPGRFSSAPRGSSPITRRRWSYLGLTDAMLRAGADEAIQEGKAGLRDFYRIRRTRGLVRRAMTNLALIYACVRREGRRAGTAGEVSVELPVGITYGDLKRKSRSGTHLRGDPRFEKIVTSLAPKEEPNK